MTNICFIFGPTLEVLWKTWRFDSLDFHFHFSVAKQDQTLCIPRPIPICDMLHSREDLLTPFSSLHLHHWCHQCLRIERVAQDLCASLRSKSSLDHCNLLSRRKIHVVQTLGGIRTPYTRSISSQARWIAYKFVLAYLLTFHIDHTPQLALPCAADPLHRKECCVLGEWSVRSKKCTNILGCKMAHFI